MKKKILAFSVGRSDYDRYYPILNEINKNKKLELKLLLSSVHFLKYFGETYKFISKKFKYFPKPKKIKIKNLPDIVNKDSEIIISQISKINPDVILVLGDRFEMLNAAYLGTFYKVPIVHFYGGSVTEGAIDNNIRNAITKLSHFHFVAHKDYKKRLIRMGEEKKRIVVSGIHELDLIKKSKTLNKIKFLKKYGLDTKSKIALVNFYPETLSNVSTILQIRNLLTFLKKNQIQSIFTYPNMDNDYNIIVNEIHNYINKNKKSKNIFIKNSGVNNYTNLLKNCDFMIGNSSSGIVEAASFNLPVINIGDRQKGKVMNLNIFHSDYRSVSINKIYKKVKLKYFDKKFKNFKNVYHSNISLSKVVNIIKNIANNKSKFIKKKP